MCLSTVYKGNEPIDENKLAEYVTTVETYGDSLKFMDITGEELCLKGKVSRIDLISGKIFIEQLI